MSDDKPMVAYSMTGVPITESKRRMPKNVIVVGVVVVVAVILALVVGGPAWRRHERELNVNDHLNTACANFYRAETEEIRSRPGGPVVAMMNTSEDEIVKAEDAAHGNLRLLSRIGPLALGVNQVLNVATSGSRIVGNEWSGGVTNYCKSL